MRRNSGQGYSSRVSEMDVLILNGRKIEGEVAELFVKGMTDGMMVEQELAEPKRFRLFWNEKVQLKEGWYKHIYQYDTREDALKVQSLLTEVGIFSVVADFGEEVA